MVFHDLSENQMHHFVFKIRTIYYVEMAQEPWSYRIFATRWRTHGAHKHDISQFSERIFLLRSIKPRLVIKPLSQEFNGWLGSLLFYSWHIQVINEDNELFAERRTQSPSCRLLQFALNCGLSEIGARFCTETNREIHKGLLVQFS